MFAFLIWDEHKRRLIAVRDRFGVKPLHYHVAVDGTLFVASETKALRAAGIPTGPDLTAWATYLKHGVSDYSPRTFWTSINAVPPGHVLTWENGAVWLSRWYDIAERVGDEFDMRAVDVVREEYLSLLTDSVRLRFRSDVPVGINLSGGLDSSLLLGLVQAVYGPECDIKVFTFVTGDPAYDELPWVERMLARTQHPLEICRLDATAVPDLAFAVGVTEDEPYGGVPTLAYARIFERARSQGVIVLLDGQGLDEQWAGYDYYAKALAGRAGGLVQGTQDSPIQPACLLRDFAALAEQPQLVQPFHDDPLRNLQYRDVRYTKIPRALRFNDRISMRSSTELREPFLDHRLMELAFRQPEDRKILNGASKWLPRQLARDLLPRDIEDAPKRPVQTPQREWLRGCLREWATEQIESALDATAGSWFDEVAVRTMWDQFCHGRSDNSFFVWQWISIGLLSRSWSHQAMHESLSFQ
jgi:asparagine synthase (glutamine-hydrolysing)